MRKRPICILLLLAAPVLFAADHDLARKRSDAETRWASFENPAAAKGQGGSENNGAKGHAFDSLQPGETRSLLTVNGAGEVRRIWITIDERDPVMLRSLRLDMYWDGARTPAVSVPLGDFFGAILGRPVAFENDLFSNPEGRSFNCYIPMPFRKSARIALTNESTKAVPHVFYDIDFLTNSTPDPDLLYFHAIWRRERWTSLGKDFEILPRITGEGRFIGSHLGVIVNPENTGWWGEGEVKMYLDGDSEHPTLVGTGTEDYIGTGWGQGTFVNRFQGSLVSDKASNQYTFYRYHIPDPVYFHRDLRVTIQQIGGDTKAHITELLNRNVAVKPVSIDDNGKFTKLLEPGRAQSLGTTAASENAWTNVYRRDDWSAVALFYLDRPENGLTPLADVSKRTEALAGSAH